MEYPDNNAYDANAYDALEDLYPDIYMEVYPHINSMVDVLQSEHQDMGIDAASLDYMTDEILQKTQGDALGAVPAQASFGNRRGFDARSLIQILLLRELFNRRHSRRRHRRNFRRF